MDPESPGSDAGGTPPPTEDASFSGEKAAESSDGTAKGCKTRPSMPRLVVGAFVVLLGISLLTENSDVLSKVLPAFLIVLGLVKIFGTKASSGRLFGGMLVLVGVILISGAFNLWPLLIILGGLHILWKGLGRSNVPNRGRAMSSGDTVKDFVIFGSSERIVDSREFQGGDITAVFGGVELDLRRADIPPGSEAVLDIFTMFGGIEITIPETWEVSQEASAIFGGVEDTSHLMTTPAPGERRRLILRGYALFGGIEIKN